MSSGLDNTDFFLGGGEGDGLFHTTHVVERRIEISIGRRIAN